MKLSSSQIRQLRAKAHSLNPVVLIGHHGLTPNVHEEIEQALIAHELIKIRLNQKDKTLKQQMSEEICQKHQAELVQTIGHIIAVYRERSE